MPMRLIAAMMLLLFTAGADQCHSPAPDVEIPSGTEIYIRMQTPVASSASKAGDPINATVIVPVTVGNQLMLPAGTILRGTVTQAQPIDAEHEQASLELQFTEWEGKHGKKEPLSARIVEVDNARETVDEAGRIQGMHPSQAPTTQIDQALGKLKGRSGSLAAILFGAKSAVVKEAKPEIEYPAGTEMTLRLTKAATAEPAAEGLEGQGAGPIQPEAELVGFVTAQPYQTTAEKPPKPSDMTNLMYLGSQAEIEEAFRLAGWTTAAALNAQSKLETVRAVLEARGYSEAPVSVLLLDGQEPAMVFQKQLNTFAKRHHLRIWRRPDDFHGRNVWVCAATHDVDIEFSAENKTFIHKIDPQIDRERAKVVVDLLYTGRVTGLSLVSRPEVPRESKNATGDALITDGKMAVLQLRAGTSPQ
jgi:hypothetical protein